MQFVLIKKNNLYLFSILCLLLNLVFAQTPPNVLVISTNSAESATHQMGNYITEFTNAGAIVTHINNANITNSITADSFVTVNGGKYDVVVVTSLYIGLDPSNWAPIQTAIQNRDANMFVFFTDTYSGSTNSANTRTQLGNIIANATTASPAWPLVPSVYPTESVGTVNAARNDSSPFITSFTGLNPLIVHYAYPFRNIPLNNIIYTDPNDTATPKTRAFGALVPVTESYNGSGACLFMTTDGNPLAQTTGNVTTPNRTKIGPAILNAITAGGSCQIPVSVSASFDDTTVALGDTFNYTVTVNNAVNINVTDLLLQHDLTSRMTVNNISANSCGGTATPTANGFTLTGGTVTALTGCSITLHVTWSETATCNASPFTTTIIPGSGPGQGFSTSLGYVNTPAPATVTCYTPQISVAKTLTSATPALPGQAVTYQIVATNTTTQVGIASLNLVDTLPTDINPASISWSCSPTINCPSPASGTGNINQSFPIEASGTATFVVTGTLNLTPAPAATLANTATITPTNGNCVSSVCNSTVNTSTGAILEVTTTLNSGNYPAPGGTTVFDLVIENTSNADATNIALTNTLSSDVSTVNWTCSATGTAVCPAAAGTGLFTATPIDIASNSQLTFSITTVMLDQSLASTIPHNASIAFPSNNAVCADGNTTGCSDSISATTASVVAITKTTTFTGVVEHGDVIEYLVTVTNESANPATVTVSDPIPTGIDSISWSCNGSCNNTSGTTAINENLTLAANSSVSYTITATALASGTLPASIDNTATISVTSTGGVCSATTGCSANVVLSTAPAVNITYTVTTTPLAQLGSTVNYTLVVTNNSLNPVSGISLITDSNVLPTGVTALSWTCSGTGTCTASGTGAINDSVNLDVGETVTYNLTATLTSVPANLPALISSTVTAEHLISELSCNGSTLAPSPVSCSQDIATGAVVSVTKTSNLTATERVIPAGTVEYTVTVTNESQVVANVTITDPLPTGMVSSTWSCVGSCPATGTGSITETLALPANSAAVFTIIATADNTNLPANIVNTASVTVNNGVCTTPDDPLVPSQCSAVETLAPAPVIDVTYTVVGGQTTVSPGSVVNFELKIHNTSNVKAEGIAVSHPLPAGFTAMQYDCFFDVTLATCPVTFALVSGEINQDINLEPNETTTFTINATLDANPANIPNPIKSEASVNLTSLGVTSWALSCASVASPIGTCTIFIPFALFTPVESIPSITWWSILGMVITTAYVVRRRQWHYKNIR